jgi:predicted nucleic-acid-binding protein
MIVVDTNLLLRYLLNDDAAQAKRAQRLLEGSASAMTQRGPTPPAF